jgi:hypothetical protein
MAGLIPRIERTNRHVLTLDGIKVAVFYTKLHNQHVSTYITRARLSRAA